MLENSGKSGFIRLLCTIAMDSRLLGIGLMLWRVIL
jgi:hypothetical protein